MSDPAGVSPRPPPVPAASPAAEGIRHRKLPFADRALTIMLFVLVVDIFLVAPVSELTAGSRHWSHIILVTVLCLGALAIWGNLWLTDMFVAMSIACVGSRLAYIRWGHDEFLYVGYVMAAGTLTILGYLLARRVFARGRVNLHRIQGAVAVYLIAGMVLAQVLQVIALAYPGAFLLLGHPASHEAITDHIVYYSFVTLTTLGFGDITPVNPLARSFTLLGAIFGTLYPAILIGRLVQQQMSHEEG
jgi:hypothetical protein